MSKNQEILVTRTDLERCGFGRERVRSALARITPAKVERRARFYDLTTAISAALAEGETGREREARLRGDMLEERLRRMRGEVLPMKDVVAIWHDKLARLAHAIRGIDGINHKQKSRLCQQLRHEVEQIPSELNEVSFPESEEADSGMEEADTVQA